MTRSSIREIIFQIIFEVELNRWENMPLQVDVALKKFASLEEFSEYCEILNKPDEEEIPVSMEVASEEESELIKAKAKDIIAKFPELDEEISRFANDWSLNRIGNCEHAILRLAVYEMLHDDEVPYKVAINEAVELSKKYCNKEASAFINGILGKLSRDKGLE